VGAEHTAAAVLNRLRGPLMGIPEAMVIPFNPPAIQGLGQFGGFQFVLEDQGRNTLQAIADTANQLAAQSRTNPDLAGLFRASRRTIRSTSCTSTGKRRKACRCR